MKVGDLVRYGKWHPHEPVGMIIKADADPPTGHWFLVMWSDTEAEWEEDIELEMFNECY